MVSVQLEQSNTNGVDMFVTVICENYDKIIISYINAISELLGTLFRNVGADIAVSASPYMEIDCESRYYSINFTYPIRIDSWYIFDTYKEAVENEQRLLEEEKRAAHEAELQEAAQRKKANQLQNEQKRQERYQLYLNLKNEFDK
ncbi:hypothetical protein Xoosp13_388 [Xanthomonas phage Xoo-sp13]|nr:hypothetical protein Xoosp13_388 [Xanthomonas phage Xoo-sp13]